MLCHILENFDTVHHCPWIFQDLPVVIRRNQTAREMMRRIEILVEHFRGSIFPSPQGQEHSAEDWELKPQFYLVL